ncbi:hypothetical protein OG458_42705 (plasmid) [Streptomyces sp. NBC_01281]|uniref:DUF6197 family protein n=1 Tax=Streptomyces sp. NBC_01281 TaxID=2903811 RepID=UPI002E10B825|nr:hypothetical protein OG458_42705 [Streptomyces sp. NBC_01281]
MPTRLPSLARPDPTTTAPADAPPLSLEERLALVNAAMTARLDEAAVAYEVNTAHIDTKPVDLADIVTGPIDTSPAKAPDLYPTPVAAVLQRAHRRLVSGGWCANALVDADGARCMLGAVRIEARGDRRLEGDAASVLLDAIRRQFGDHVDSVPSFNDAHGTAAVPLRMVDQAADLADARGL